MSIFVGVISIFFGKNPALKYFGGIFMGGVISVTLLLMILGQDQFLAILEQIWYWTNYSKDIWSLPLFTETNAPSLWIIILLILIQNGVLVYLWQNYQYNKKLGNLLKQNPSLLFFTVAFFLFMKIPLDRSDIGHIHNPALLPFIFLIIILGFAWIKTFGEEFIEKACSFLKRQLIFSMIMLGFFLLKVDAKAMAHKLNHLVEYGSLSDDKLFPEDYSTAINAMKAEVDESSCFFTLTSEGVWYFLFKKPSYSRFHHIVYARTTKAQEEVIHDLGLKKPKIILFNNLFWSNYIDGISTANTNPLIFQYVFKNYQPYKLIGSHWFWIKTDIGMMETIVTEQTDFGGILSILKISKMEVEINGWIKSQILSSADAIYVSYEDEHNILTAVPVPQTSSSEQARRVHWSVKVPIASLPPGNIAFQVWAYDSNIHQRIKVGSFLNLILNKH